MINTNKPITLSQTEIDALVAADLRKRNVEVFSYPKFPGSTEADVFYVRKPSRPELEMVSETSTAKGVSIANDLLINTCVLAGPMALLETDDDLTYGLLKDITALVEAKKKS